MIVIATPARDVVQATFTYDLAQLLRQESDVVFAIALGSIIPNNRNNLVKQSLEVGASHILFIDSDMRFPPDTLQRLLAHDKDVVGANCKQRMADEWTAWNNDERVSSDGKIGIQRVEAIGCGVTLIKIELFKKLNKPWFAMPYKDTWEKLMGEDVYFCNGARVAGFKIWVDHDLSQEVKHTGSKEF